MHTTSAPRFVRPALGLIALAVAVAPALAQTRKELGRMWTFEAAPLGWFKEAYDWQPTQEWLDHARLSSLRFGQDREASEGRPGGISFFCSASFVSPHGLIMTNHHCSRDAIASVQGKEDWLKDGFFAGSFENEVKLPRFLMTQLVRQQDVTEAVNASDADTVKKQAQEQDPAHRHEVIALYQGGNYQLYSFKVFDDIRLVCAPHGQVAHFGGDPDNFCYPRWGLDFTFLRAYENDKPVDSKAHFFGWRTEGAKEGDLVFVTGNPGRTGRLQSVAQCEYTRDHQLPTQLEGIKKRLAEANEKAKASAEAEKELRPRILSLENSRKALQGYLDGLRTPRIMAIKQKAESDLRAAVAKSTDLQKKYGDAWDAIAKLQADKVAAAGDVPKLRGIAEEEKAQNKRIGEACFAVYGNSIPPDATMSLRISDGVVKGYAMNGTLAPFFTTLYGLFARHAEFGGEHPFDLPKAWLDQEKQLDMKTPFNVVSTCDIIGGNSGSPMIDKEQRVVGLVFDGNIEMLGNNYVFDDEVSRSVSVHPAIIIESLRKVYGAAKLADELEQKAGGADGKRTGAADAAKPDGADRAGREAMAAKSQTDVRALADTVKMYYLKKRELPDSLAVLLEKDEKGRAYLDELSDDPWGNAYVLVLGERPTEFEVLCCGPDGKRGTDDDVSSKKKRE